MTLDQVLVFTKIVQLGSFKHAANELHKTQPAISFSIKKLEEELEVELFDRTSYRPTLTPHGRMFLERSQKVLQGMQELENLAQSFRHDEEPEVFISIDGIYMETEMLKLFKSFRDQSPNTKIHLSFDILSEAERRVLGRETQIGLTHFVSHHSALDIVPITEIRMMPVINAELFREKKIKSQADLAEIDQIIVGDKNGPSGASFGLLDTGKKWRLMDANFKREIIIAGLGWGHLPEHSIAREIKDGRVKVLSFEDIHPRVLDIKLIRLKKMNHGPVARKIWDELIAFHGK